MKISVKSSIEKVPHRALILRDVERIITKDRNNSHGEPEDSFSFIADYWNVYLKHKGKLTDDAVITDVDVAAMMGLFKRGRADINIHHEDSNKDLIGYSAIEYELIKKNSNH